MPLLQGRAALLIANDVLSRLEGNEVVLRYRGNSLTAVVASARAVERRGDLCFGVLAVLLAASQGEEE